MKKHHVNWISLLFGLYTAFLLLGLLIVLITSQRELHLFINSKHHPFTDFFFKYITHLGDGVVILLLIPYLLLKYRLKIIYLGITTFLYAAFLAQFLKKIIFYNIKRPKGIFDEGVLRIIEGVNLHSHHSFPSGHTATIVALCCFLGFLSKGNRLYQLFFFTLSILVAFSRVYISQHFFEDILAGTLLGILSFYLAYVTVKVISAEDKSFINFRNIKQLEIDF